MARRQTTLLASWLKPAKKQKVHVESEIMSAEEQVGNCNLELDLACEVGEAAGNLEAECSKQAYGVTETAIHAPQTAEVASQPAENEAEPNNPMTSQPQTELLNCTAPCCSMPHELFQPTDKSSLAKLSVKKRNFQAQWYKRFPWLTVCFSTKKGYCLWCRYASQHSLIVFSKMGEKAFKTGKRL